MICHASCRPIHRLLPETSPPCDVFASTFPIQRELRFCRASWQSPAKASWSVVSSSPPWLAKVRLAFLLPPSCESAEARAHHPNRPPHRGPPTQVIVRANRYANPFPDVDHPPPQSASVRSVR